MGTSAVVVEGSSPLAVRLRAAEMRCETLLTIVVPHVITDPTPFDQLTDEQFDEAWEQPMRETIVAFQRAHENHRERLVALVPTIGMSGAPQLAHVAATAEAIRALVKSAARQWGADGITVNCIAAAPALFGIDSSAVGTVSIAPPALASTGDLVADIVPLIHMLGSRDAHHITGSTLTADGGIWMSP